MLLHSDCQLPKTVSHIYDETDGKCKKACLMTAGFGSITVMDKDGYAITVADRNL